LNRRREVFVAKKQHIPLPYPETLFISLLGVAALGTISQPSHLERSIVAG
jgi:hypothetical protein